MQTDFDRSFVRFHFLHTFECSIELRCPVADCDLLNFL